jgi:hypothetical protein
MLPVRWREAPDSLLNQATLPRVKAAWRALALRISVPGKAQSDPSR